MNETEPKSDKQTEGTSERPHQERQPTLEPRIYVASLSDHNAGRLHGVWLNLDAGTDAESLAERVQTMLAASPEPGAEEYAIHDYEGFGPLRIDEYQSLESVARIASGITEHGPAFAHWAALIGTSDLDALERFEDSYLGHYDSLEVYAESMIDDFGVEEEIEKVVPDFLAPYVRVDIEGFGRDMELSGAVSTSAGDGGIYIFDGTI